MSISAADFLASAKQLLLDAEQQGEVAIRNAMSRAYYAAFHQARSVFPVDSGFARNAGTGMHEAYIDQLMRSNPGTTERHTAVKLKGMKGRRGNADYRLGDDLPAYHAVMQVKAAEDVFQLLDEASKSRAQVGALSESACVALESSAAIVDDSPPRATNRPTLQRIQ